MVSLPKYFTEFNLRIFELLLDNSYSVRDLAKENKCSPAKVIQFIDAFKPKNLIGIRRDKNKKIISLNRVNPLTKGIISLIFLDKIFNSNVFSKLKKTAVSVGIYGSVVDGLIDKQSDIDFWVLVKKRKNFLDEARLKNEFSKELGRDVSLKFFTSESIQQLKIKDKIFYNELDYKSKILFGEGFG